MTLLYNTMAACEELGGISPEKLKDIAGEFAIPIGKGNFYKPEDLKIARDRLPYGKKES